MQVEEIMSGPSKNVVNPAESKFYRQKSVNGFGTQGVAAGVKQASKVGGNKSSRKVGNLQTVMLHAAEKK